MSCYSHKPFIFSKHLSTVPSLICLPVTYAYGGTTRE